MNFYRVYKGVFFAVSFVCFLSVVQGHSKAGSKTYKIQEKVIKTIEIRQETQKKEADWAGKKEELTARYRSLSYSNKHFEKVKEKTVQMLNSQKDLVDETKRKIEESVRIQEGLQSYLESVIVQLEEFIKRDLPFLTKERSDRLVLIKGILANHDRPAAEKYRRVMEVLQIETGYGHTVEVYQDTVDLDGQPVLVDILRLGRLSLFCQTSNGEVVGHYDRVSKKWISLSSEYRRDINKAVEMARHERTIDLVRLPIGRIVP
jgi:predicted transcriptional regulator